MPRTARSTEAGMVYHVLNRGNGRMRVFPKGEDFEAFERVLPEGLQRYPVDLFTYCVMPNHWHLVVRPKTDDALGRWLGWVGVTHVRRHHEHYHTRGGGHLYQGRFKSFPVAEDEYFLALCRYVEANALRAGLVARAEDWQWSSLWRRAHGSAELPLRRKGDITDYRSVMSPFLASLGYLATNRARSHARDIAADVIGKRLGIKRDLLLVIRWEYTPWAKQPYWRLSLSRDSAF